MYFMVLDQERLGCMYWDAESGKEISTYTKWKINRMSGTYGWRGLSSRFQDSDACGDFEWSLAVYQSCKADNSWVPVRCSWTHTTSVPIAANASVAKRRLAVAPNSSLADFLPSFHLICRATSMQIPELTAHFNLQWRPLGGSSGDSTSVLGTSDQFSLCWVLLETESILFVFYCSDSTSRLGSDSTESEPQ